MFEGLLTLASYGLGTGGTAGNFLFQLEQQGVFAYVLPFLMIFAITYGILDKTGIFSQNGINVILSLAVGLMALQMNFVSYFFREIFPRMGIMLSIILVLIILLGLFFDFKNKTVKVILGGAIAIGVIVILFQSFNVFSWIGYGWSGSGTFRYWFERNGMALITGILVVAGIFAIVNKGGGSKKIDMKKAGEKIKNMAAQD